MQVQILNNELLRTSADITLLFLIEKLNQAKQHMSCHHQFGNYSTNVLDFIAFTRAI